MNRGHLKLVVETAYRRPADRVYLEIDWSDEQYTMNFAEALRAKVREARAPSLKVETRESNRAAFVDELERLANLRKQGGLTEEEFEVAKKKLLS